MCDGSIVYPTTPSDALVGALLGNGAGWHEVIQLWLAYYAAYGSLGGHGLGGRVGCGVVSSDSGVCSIGLPNGGDSGLRFDGRDVVVPGCCKTVDSVEQQVRGFDNEVRFDADRSVDSFQSGVADERRSGALGTAGCGFALAGGVSQGLRVTRNTDDVSAGYSAVSRDCGNGSVDAGQEAVNGIGPNTLRNRKKRERKKRARALVGRLSSLNGSVEPVTGGSTILSVAEDEARRTLAVRRAAENKVATLKAELQAQRLSDPSYTEEYGKLQRQRVAQWQNETLAKSQASFEKCKTIGVDSSVSQQEHKKVQIKVLDLEDQISRYKRAVSAVCDTQLQCRIDEIARPISTETHEDMMAEMYSAGYVDDYE